MIFVSRVAAQRQHLVDRRTGGTALAVLVISVWSTIAPRLGCDEVTQLTGATRSARPGGRGA